MWLLTFHHMSFKVNKRHLRSLTPVTSQRPIANRYIFSGVSWGAKSEFVVHCSQKRPLTTSSPFPWSIMVIRPIWILTVTAITASEGDAVLHRSTTYAKYWNGIRNNTLSCSELNREHVVRVSDRYDTYLRRYERVNIKISFSRKSDRWPDLTRSNVDLRLKTICAIARSCWDASTVLFPRSSATIRGRSPGGRTNPPPLAKVAKHGKRARVNPRPGSGLSRLRHGRGSICPPSNSKTKRPRRPRDTAIESSQWVRSKSMRSIFAQVNIEVTRGH